MERSGLSYRLMFIEKNNHPSLACVAGDSIEPRASARGGPVGPMSRAREAGDRPSIANSIARLGGLKEDFNGA
jgi:hypothetical protein